MPILDARDVEAYLDELNQHLSPLQRERLGRIAGLLGGDHRVAVVAVLDALSPDKPRDNAGTDLRKLRLAFNAAAGEAGVPIRCEVSSDKKAGAANRQLWFEGASRLAEQAERFSLAETRELDTLPSTLRQRGRIVDPAIRFTETRQGKPLVRWFLSYARKNRKTKEQFVELLNERLACSKHFAFEMWQDGDIELGDDWHASIQAALDQCHFGLLLLSHAFFNRDYIREHELPHFVGPDGVIGERKRAVPVALEAIRFERVDMLGLETMQVYRDADDKAFEQRTGQRRAAWIDGLVAKIERMLSRYLDAAQADAPRPRSGSAEQRLPVPPAGPALPSACDMIDPASDVAEALILNDALGRPTVLDKDRLEKADGPGVDALDYLLEWLRDADAPPLFALLGEYGMGKTITCQRLVRALEQARVADPALPPPLYLDLRNLTGLERGVPLLEAVVEECIRRGWRPGDGRRRLDYAQFEELVQAGALVIFDGLDEALVHLSEGDGQVFTRELLKLLALRRNARGPRVLISCRTHYFRTLRDQKNHFTGQERGELDAADYRALVLLPFKEEQVAEYLARALPGADIDQLQALIRSVHNLTELTQRPYTLKLVARFIPDIEAWRAEGRKVYGVTLYRRMVRAWLERDGGKHILKPDHKMRLMPHLAAHLARGKRRLLPIAELEAWFNTFLAAQPDLKERYAGIDRDKLEEDLRTATFLVRQDGDDGDDEGDGGAFRFAHSSMQEFFLAEHLLRALRDDQPEAWMLPLPSRETLDFLGQMLAEADDPALLARLSAWVTPYRVGVGELLLAYALAAGAHGWPVPRLRGIDLRGVDLNHWVIQGPASAPLDLDGADFRGAHLRETRWARVSVRGADFTDAVLNGCEWLGVVATRAQFRGVDLSGGRWRGCELDDAGFDDANLYRLQWMQCTGQPPAAGSGVLQVPSPAGEIAPRTRRGHADVGRADLTACTFSPDGTRLVSAGDDDSVRVWDAVSGEMLRTLRGHEGRVLSCAWSADGARLASAGADDSVRVWDAASGEALRTLRGHQGGVWSCAWSADGTRLASAGDDGSVRVWDAASGAALRTLRGHEGGVLSCAWSADGTRLASAGSDGSVRVWDAASGEALRTLRGHEGSVTSCAWSAAGTQLASVGGDGSLRVWDAASGECQRVSTMTRHGHVVWDPRSLTVIEAGGDFWRWFAWIDNDPASGAMRRYPAEAFGALPAPPVDTYAGIEDSGQEVSQELSLGPW
ncbi:MAG: pentapeptide repeat-containing protein [Zoogloeaceae bacterium]|nr:pentapeptide repeat-containing protein [Zoogloeaceae bacterium]